MPFTEEDTRKVQTAVSGHVDSALPVFLPMDADSFGAFMRRYPERAFYCGTLLGGCGKKLTPKHYRDRKCHFAHLSAAANCRRVDSDESSADHLYIGQALTDWLRMQEQRSVRADYRPNGLQVRDVVDVSYGSARRLIRVQLARRSKREWEEADSDLQAGHTGLHWLFGPDSLVANWQVERRGYALRVQCRSVGATREVEIGTQVPDRPVEWTSLSKCTITPEGIVTPSLLHTPHGIVPHETAPTRTDSRPLTLPLRPASVLITDATPSHATATHRLYDVSVRLSGRLALPLRAATPDAHDSYLPMGATLSLDDAGTWLIAAEALHHLEDRADDRERQDDGTPDDAASTSPQGHSTPSGADADLVASFRAGLENAARSRNVVNMETLRKRASSHGYSLSPDRWRDLLVQVEQPRAPGAPVLSALINGQDGGPAPFFREVLHSLGWTDSISPAELLDIWRSERARAHTVHGKHRGTSAQPLQGARRPHVSPSAGTPVKEAVNERRATFDALIDVAHEGQQSGDLDALDIVLAHLEFTARPAGGDETVRAISDWLVDQRAEELYASWERLSSLVDRLNRDGDDLHPDELRVLLRHAEKAAQDVGEELASEELRDMARWRRHLSRLADRLTLRGIHGYAVAVRMALRQAARQGRTTTWAELATHLGAPLAALDPDDKVAVLVEADRETPADAPLLSALIAAHGVERPHPLYRQVLFNLDRPVPSPEAMPMHWHVALRRHYGRC